MWFKKASPRRQAIREDVAEAGSIKPWWGGIWQIAVVGGVFFVAASILQFWPGNPLPFRLGERAPMDLKAPVSFTIDDPVRTEIERTNARAKSPPVLKVEAGALQEIQNDLLLLRVDSLKAKSVDDLSAATKARFPGIDNDGVRTLNSIESEELYKQNVQTFMRAMQGAPIVARVEWEAMKEATKEKQFTEVMPIASGDIPDWMQGVPLNEVYVIDGPASNAARGRLLDTVNAFPKTLMTPIGKYLENIRTPTFHVDAKLTVALEERRAKEARSFGDSVKEGEMIVGAGKQIDEKAYQMLVEAHEKLRQKQAQDYPWAMLLSNLGRVLVVLILTVAGTIYIAKLAGAKVTVQRAWSVCGLLLVALVAAKMLVAAFPGSLYCTGLMPTLLAAIILVIAHNQRFALGVATLHGLLLTFTLGQSIDFFLAILAGVTVFSLGLGEIRTRSKLIEVGFVASVVLFGTIWAIGLSRMGGAAWIPWGAESGVLDSKWVGTQSLWGVMAGVGVAMVALFILPPVERVFKITTAMTLLELCDANKPLLQRLSQEAPGTFNHSLTVGIMSEAAGNAIGANGLLCRVGAYYHDVGKLSKPQYFIENQAAGHPNRHDKLSPAMSLLIIVGHVKDGIELAREYGLPWVIHQFIGQHHGTTLVEYFFHAARKRAEQTSGPGVGEGKLVSETEFRYPGPRPQSREVAIVMICDGCESAVRAIEEPTPGRIETAVHNMITKRLMDSQFSECDLTLRDLSIIEETLVRTLAGIHHGRVAYPAKMEETGTGDVGISQPA